jgi:hypothetical protein
MLLALKRVISIRIKMAIQSGTIKYLTLMLILIIISLIFPVAYLGNQANEAQEKVENIKNQIATYQNQSTALQNQKENLTNIISQLENSPDNITLTVVSVGPWGADPLEGYPYYKFINLTLQNNGARVVGGMTLDSELKGNTSNLDYLSINVDTTKGVIHPNESMNLSMQLIAPHDNIQQLEKYELTINLILDKTVLDQKTVELWS